IALLPIEKVEPTPFQRDVSDTHRKKLENVIAKTGRFLDPIVVVTAPKGGYWTPNGNHRLQAMKELGAKAVTALVVPEHEVAWQILALNTERAHNLKERSLEVIRIYRNLLEERGDETEESFDYFLEEPALITLGAVYEKNGRFAGGAYGSVLKRAERFSSEPIKKAIKTREHTAGILEELEEKVADVVKRLREKGLTSPYLRAFVVARINPLRFSKSEPPPIDDVLEAMRDKAAKFNVDKVRQQDLMGASGPPPEE
ncbi:MAG TPA: ParB N-terminal domain-containing protein, partial [Polyangiaceae bacterium]|nr:ParB N-terminal domain-containing protein [Polyangiaceae bacterium]